MRRIKVKYTKLGRQKAWGMAHSEGFIEVDHKIKGKKLLEILIHESLHILYPLDSEEEIVHKSVILCNTLWNEKFRRIDSDNTIPLQDGTK